MPRITVAPHTPALASDFNAVSDQSVMVFDNAAQRTTAIPTPVEGMTTYRKDLDVTEFWDGTAWRLLSTQVIYALLHREITGTTGTTGNIPLGDLVVDYTYGNITAAATGVTIAVAGVYEVTHRVRFGTTAAVPCSALILAPASAGTTVAASMFMNTPAGSTNNGGQMILVAPFAIGDVIRFGWNQSTASAVSYTGGIVNNEQTVKLLRAT